MPSLSKEAAHKFWYDYQDPIIYRVLNFMEAVENWTRDGDPTLEAALTKLGEALENISDIDLKEKDKFIEVTTYIKAARALRLLQCLDTAYPGAASKLLAHAEEISHSDEDTPGIFLRRNIVFERLRLLGRAFSQERFNLINKALEGIT